MAARGSKDPAIDDREAVVTTKTLARVKLENGTKGRAKPTKNEDTVLGLVVQFHMKNKATQTLYYDFDTVKILDADGLFQRSQREHSVFDFMTAKRMIGAANEMRVWLTLELEAHMAEARWPWLDIPPDMRGSCLSVRADELAFIEVRPARFPKEKE